MSYKYKLKFEIIIFGTVNKLFTHSQWGGCTKLVQNNFNDMGVESSSLG